MTIRRCVLLLLILLAACCHAADTPEQQQIRQLLSEGRGAEALAAARAWTTAHPDLPEALLVYADVQRANDDIQGALESLDSAFFLTRDVNVLIRRGRILLDAGRHDEAEKQLQDVVRQQETCVAAHVGLALVLMARGRTLEANASLQTALTLDPKSVDALAASAKLKVDEPQTARELLLQVVQLDPSMAEAYLDLGRLAAEADDIAQARQYWLKYTELAPGTPAQWQLAHNFYPIRSRPFPCEGSFPAFAPDGKRVAFAGRTDRGNAYLATLDNLAAPERILQGTGTIYALNWSPDGKYLLCKDYTQETVQGNPQYTYRLLLIGPTAGGEARKLYEGRYVGTASWLPDSQWVVFDGYVEKKGRPMLRVPITGGEPQIVLTPQPNESFSGCLVRPTEPMPADGGLPRLLLHRWHVPSREYQVVEVDPRDRKQDRIIVRCPQALNYTAIGPDARTFLYFRRSGQPQTWSLVALPLDEQGPGHALPFKTVMPMPPALTADGEHLILYDRQGLCMMDLVGVKE